MQSAPELFSEGALVGHFRLEKTIGRGGMGVVWSAVDERDGKRVALKFLDDVRRDDPVSHARFLREAELATKLTHPNVIRVHAIDYTLEGTPFLVMDLLEGESLRARMKAEQRLSAKECGELLAPVAAAARAAHEAGIVHRDLKPENVFLTTDSGVRVLDFGIAKRLSADEVKDTFTSTGAVLGTPAYMAPEQIFGERDIDGKADVWALGVILYECLSGARPVEGGVGQILKAATSGRMTPLRAEPVELSRFVMKMLATEPGKRPSMDEVERILVGLRDEAPRAKRVPVALLVGAVVVALGVGAIAAFNARHSSVAAIASVASESASATSAPSSPTLPSAEASVAVVIVDAAAPTPSATHARTASQPPPSSSVTFTRAAEFDVVLGRVGGMGNASTQSDVVAALRAMKPCLPAPTDSERWTIALDASWPKGRARAFAFEPRRNGAALANAQIEACAKKTFDAARIATPDGQDDVGGTSYVRMSVGYY